MYTTQTYIKRHSNEEARTIIVRLREYSFDGPSSIVQRR